MYIGYDNTHRMIETWFGGGELMPLVAPMCNALDYTLKPLTPSYISKSKCKFYAFKI